MDIRLVEDFLDVCKTRSISESAGNRLVSQPTLSRRIQQLEDWVGYSLLDRKNRPIKLTRHGAAFYPIARQMQHWLQSLETRLGNALESDPMFDVAFNPSAVGGSIAADALKTAGESGIVPRNVLVVDDSPLSLELLGALARDLGHNPTVCQSPEDALYIAKTGKFDIAFVDYRMPNLNGAAWAQSLRRYEKERDRGSAQLRVVGVSATTDLTSISDCFEGGMDDFICKPVGRKQMQLLLDRWVPASRTLESLEQHAMSNFGCDAHLREYTQVSAALYYKFHARVEAVSQSIDIGKIYNLPDEIFEMRNDSFQAGAYSFGRACTALAQSVLASDMRAMLEDRGPFLSEFVRLKRALHAAGLLHQSPAIESAAQPATR